MGATPRVVGFGQAGGGVAVPKWGLHAQIVTVGPAPELERQLEGLGAVDVIAA